MAKSVLKVSALRKDSEAYTELYNKDGMEVYATKSGKFEIHCGATHTWASNLVDVAEKINHLDLHTFPGSGNDVVAAIKAKLGQQFKLEIKASKNEKEKVLHTVEGSLDKIADNMMGISPVDIRTMTAGQRYAMGPNMYNGDYMILIPMSMGIDDSSFAVPQMYEKQVFGKGMVLNGLDPATGELVSIVVSEAYPNGAFKDGDGKVWSDEDKDLYQFAIGTPATEVEPVDFNEPTDSIYESEDIPSYNPVGVVKEQAPMVGNLKNYDNMLTAGANVIHDFMKTCKKAAFIDRSSLNKITVTAINSDGQATDGEMSWNVRVTSPNYKRSSCITIPLIMKEGSIDLGREFITSTGQKYPLTAASLKEHLGALAEDDFWRRASRKDMSDSYPSTLHADKDVDALLAGVEIKEEKRYMNPETGSIDTYDGWFYKNEDGKEVNAVDLGEVVEVDKNGNATEVSKKTAETLIMKEELQDVRENPEDYGLLPGQVDTMTDEEIEVFLEEKMHVVSATETIPKSKQTPIGADADQKNNVSADKTQNKDKHSRTHLYTLGVVFMGDNKYMDNKDVVKEAVKKFGEVINLEVGEDGVIECGIQVDSTNNALAVARAVDALGGVVDSINKGNWGLIAENHGAETSEEFVKAAFDLDKEATKKTAAIAIIYDISKMVDKDNVEEGASGEVQDMGTIDSGVVWSPEELIEKVTSITGTKAEDLVVFENGRLTTNINEDAEGNPVVDEKRAKELSDAGELYLADYNVYIKLGDGSEATEDRLAEMLGLKKYGTKKATIKKRAVAKTHKVDTTEIGDGGTPNKYWVSTSKDFMANTMEEAGVLEWASEIKALNWKVSNEGSEFGPYNTFKEAKAKYDELYSELGSEPREDGFNTISIEDRVSGQVYDGGVIGYASRFGYKFEIEEHDDTSYTSKHLGYDITTEEPGEETTETKETV
jgi:hypothetical protein